VGQFSRDGERYAGITVYVAIGERRASALFGPKRMIYRAWISAHSLQASGPVKVPSRAIAKYRTPCESRNVSPDSSRSIAIVEQLPATTQSGAVTLTDCQY
jgi:hypothetical protein